MLAKGPRLKAMHESGLQARALGHFYFLVKLSDNGKEALQPALELATTCRQVSLLISGLFRIGIIVMVIFLFKNILK
jgi:hypothetical protein